MARHAGVSKTRVQQLWSRNDLKPPRLPTVSRHPLFESRCWDITGLYLSPPEKALALCCKQRSQYLELARTGLPLGLGHVRTRTRNFVRKETVALFAGLSYLGGKVFSQTKGR